MARILLRFLFRLALVVAVCDEADAQALLEPPFGLKWGDSPEKLISWASRHSLDVNISLPGKQPALRVVTISAKEGPLPDSSANAVEGRFLHGRLFEVTVHYRPANADANRVDGDFQKLKRELIAEYGELTANRTDRTVQDHFATRTMSLHREPVKGLFLLLAYTEVEDQLRQKREATFSLIYRNDNFREDLERRHATGNGATELR